MDTVTVYVSEALNTGSFPDSLTCANVRPIYEKEDTFVKRNHRPVCTLPLLSKVYERVIYEQALNYFKPFFSMKFCVDLEKHKKHIVRNMLYFYQRCLHGRTCALLKKFIEIQGWLLLTFFICLRNQLSSFNFIICNV